MPKQWCLGISISLSVQQDLMSSNLSVNEAIIVAQNVLLFRLMSTLCTMQVHDWVECC